MSISTHKKILASLVLAAFLIVGLFGLFHFAMNNGGDTLGCPFMNITALCAMNPFAHIAVWQNMFVASFPKEIFSLLAIAVLIVLFAFTSRSFWRSDQTALLFIRIRRPAPQTFIARNPLQEAFSSGILNPKIF